MKRNAQVVLTTFLIFCFGLTFSQTTDSLSISPNPFSSSTTIHFNIGETDTISLQVVNSGGQIIKTFYKSTLLQSGLYNLNLLGDSLNDELYFIRLKIGDKKTIIKKAIKNGLTTNLGNNESHKKDLLLFPNPTKDFITIPFDGNKTIILTDQKGRVIKSFSTDQRTISISDLETGQYFITVSTDKNEIIMTQKIIKND